MLTIKNCLYLIFVFSFFFAPKTICAFVNPIKPEHAKLGDKFADLNYLDYANLEFASSTFETNSVKLNHWNYPHEFVQDPITGFKHAPNTKSRQILRSKNEIIFDSVYTFDELGRRATPVKKTDSYTKFISLFGCSFTYGHGLDDDETLNYFIASSQKDYFPYNYGIGAGALHQQLALINQPNFMSDVKEKEGAFVYVFINDHINRALGKVHNIAVMRYTPYFEENNSGEMVSLGSFDQVRPFYTRSLLWIHSVFANNILRNRQFPSFGKFDDQKYCKLVVQTRNVLQKKIPKSPFIFYGHPISSTPEELKTC
jgi:hypothetical protein